MLRKWFGKKKVIEKNTNNEIEKTEFYFSTHHTYAESLETTLNKIIQQPFPEPKHNQKFALDSNNFYTSQAFQKVVFNQFGNIPQLLFQWYGSQSFIGYQVCGILAQHWLIYKCCSMPAEDAIRNWFRTTVNDGVEVDPKIINEIEQSYKKYNIREKLNEFETMGRVFGFRIALFKVDSPDEDYYKKPFNIDGVRPGSYKGIVQIDPFWMSPQLNAQASGDPTSLDFYEPTSWLIGGMEVHSSHLIIMRTTFLPDILKPTYFFGSIPVPQMIYERVYAAERGANEAPLLLLTKRLDVLNIDSRAGIANQISLDQRLNSFSKFRDNFGTKVIDLTEKLTQFDTTLSEVDNVIMTQYQLVAAAANVPAVKLLGTSPKGFNATGAHEERSYHEHLKSIQEHHLTKLIDRHILIFIKSEIYPKYPELKEFSVDIVWNPVNQVTALELAEINKKKAETGKILIEAGAISSEIELNRVINDPESGYSGIEVTEDASDQILAQQEEEEEKLNDNQGDETQL